MNVRHTLGDVGLAVLLALPTATLASPSTIFWQSRSAVEAPEARTTALTPQAVLPSRFDIPG